MDRRDTPESQPNLADRSHRRGRAVALPAQRLYWRLIQIPAAEERAKQRLTEPPIDTRIRIHLRQKIKIL
jgi:hypothetical protein